MKIKQFVVITDPEAFLRQDYTSCLSLFDHEPGVNDWIVVKEIEIDMTGLDLFAMINTVSTVIDEKMSEYQALIEVLKNRKAELLALPAPLEDSETRVGHYDESRTLGNGQVKDTLTGYVEEPTCTHIDDYKDL